MVSALSIGMGVLGVLLIAVCGIIVIKIVSAKCLRPRKVEPAPLVKAHDGNVALQLGNMNKSSDLNI